MTRILGIAVLVSAMAHSCFGAVVITMFESGTNVQATVSGAINSLTGATATGTNGVGTGNYFRPASATASFAISTTPGIVTKMYVYYNVPILPNNFGTSTAYTPATSGLASANMSLRNDFIPNQALQLEPTYVLGTPITANLTWANASLVSLGVTPGTYVWDWTGDSVTLNIVPEPIVATMPLLLIGGITLLKRRRT